MPDISLCRNEQCPKKKYCYRFNATPEPMYQSYADFKPDDKGNCDGFQKMESQKPKALRVTKARKI